MKMLLHIAKGRSHCLPILYILLAKASTSPISIILIAEVMIPTNPSINSNILLELPSTFISITILREKYLKVLLTHQSTIHIRIYYHL